MGALHKSTCYNMHVFMRIFHSLLFWALNQTHTHKHTLAPDPPQFELHCQIAALNGRQRRHNLSLLLQLANESEQKKNGKENCIDNLKNTRNCVAAAAIKVACPLVYMFVLRLQSLLLLLIKLNNSINHFTRSVFCCKR